jgi:MFS family permease
MGFLPHWIYCLGMFLGFIYMRGADGSQSWDAFDFFTVSLTTSNLAAQFGVSITDITWGITLVLMLRSVGSIIFGIAADRYGRKWPFVVNNILFIVLELVSLQRTIFYLIY